MIRYLTVLLLFFISSDKIEYKLLADGFTKVPADENYFTKNYRNNKKLQVGPPDGVAFNVLYVPLHVPKKNTIYVGHIAQWPEFRTHALMFYENGCVNTFVSEEGYPDITLNPEHQGYRGISYKKKGKNYISTIGRADDQSGNITEHKPDVIEIRGDTLITRIPGHISYYIKDKSGIKTNYTANW